MGLVLIANTLGSGRYFGAASNLFWSQEVSPYIQFKTGRAIDMLHACEVHNTHSLVMPASRPELDKQFVGVKGAGGLRAILPHLQNSRSRFRVPGC